MRPIPLLSLVLGVTLLAASPAPAGLNVAGTYTFSGKDLQSTIIIKRRKDGRFELSAEATNDRLLHDGSYEGVFELKGNVARFREVGPHGGCDLVFVFKNDKLVVTQNPEYGNCDCGAGVSFDGVYQRLQHTSRDQAKRPTPKPKSLPPAVPTGGTPPTP